MGYITVVARLLGIYGNRKPTLPSGCALGLGRFTAINPYNRAITIITDIHAIAYAVTSHFKLSTILLWENVLQHKISGGSRGDPVVQANPPLDPC